MITVQTERLNDNFKNDNNDVANSDSHAGLRPHGAVAKAPEKTKKAKGAFRTISEVATELGVQQHVLRFWETKFSQVRPLKRGGGRRYYRPEDVAVLKRIHELLYTEGYTIKGVQKLFRANGKSSVMEGSVGGAANTDVNLITGSPAQADGFADEAMVNAASHTASSNIDGDNVESAIDQAVHPYGVDDYADENGNQGVSETQNRDEKILMVAGFTPEQKQILLSTLNELKELRSLLYTQDKAA